MEGTPTVPQEVTQAPAAASSLETSDAAGSWNGTTLWMMRDGIEGTMVLYATFASVADARCESGFRTAGPTTEASAYGWSLAIGEDGTYYSHEMIAQAAVDGEAAGTEVDAGAPPEQGNGSSTSTIRLDAGEAITYIVAAGYAPTEQAEDRGEMAFQVECSGGMQGLRTGWSTLAFLLSDVSMSGTWASLYLDEVGRWGAQPMATWSDELPENATHFIATEPIAGRATLTSPAGAFACGPTGDIPQAARGRALCMHEYDGGATSIEISQSAIGRVGQSGTSDSWMGLLAQMEFYDWPTGS